MRYWGLLVVLVLWLGTFSVVETQVLCTDVGDFTSNTSTSVDSEVVLFSGTTGKIGKRATGTGFAYLTGGVLDTIDHQPLYNVKDYGASGNGTDDDTSAIAAAFAAAGSNSIVYFPAGTYSTFMQELTGKTGLTVRGQGRTSMLKRRPGNTQTEPILKIENSSDVIVEYLGVDLNNCLSYCSGISMGQVTRFRVQFNTIIDSNINTTNTNDKFGITIQGTPTIDAPSYVLYNILEDVQLEIDRLSNLLVQGNKVIRPRFTAGIGVFTNIEEPSSSRNVQIVDNVIQDADVSCASICVILDPNNQPDFTYSDYVIARNTILYNVDSDGEERNGIKIGTGNISTSTSGVIFQNFQIVQNTIWAHPTEYVPNGYNGIFLASGPATNFVFDRVVVAENNITLPDAGGAGINLRMIENAKIHHNTVYNMVDPLWAVGISSVRAKHTEILNNTVYGAGAKGFNISVVAAYDVDVHSRGNVAKDAVAPFFLDNDGPTGEYWLEEVHATGSAIQQIDAVGNTIGTWPGTMAVDLATAGAPLTMTSTPTLVAGHEGQRVTLLNMGTYTMTLQDERSVTGTKLYLRAPAVALAQYEMLSFRYVPALTAWVQDNDGESALTNPMTTPGDMIVGTTGGAAARVPLANQPYLNVKLPPYNAIGNGVADDTAAIQAALDDAQTLNPANAADGAGIVHLPPGTYLISTISIPKTVLLQSSNMFGGSTLLQMNGVDDDAVKLKCADADAWYYGGIRHVSLEKVQPVTDTLGSGIGVTRTSGTCSLGESARISDLRIMGFPVAGIQVAEGSAPLRITNISTFANGQFGIDLRGQHQTVLLDSISGDSNNTALINIDGTGSTYDATAIHISNVKAETNTEYDAPAGPQEIVVRLSTLVNARVTMENISATAGVGATPEVIVRLVGSRAIVTRLKDAACSGGCTNILYDENGSVAIPWDNDIQEIMYRENGRYQIISRDGYALRTLALGNNLAQPAFEAAAGSIAQTADTNGVTLQTLTRSTDSGPTGNFVTYKTAAAAAVWNVDVTGTLTVGRIPETRLIPQMLDQADTASITIDCALYNYVRVDELSQTTTFNAPATCTPNEGQDLSIAIFSTTARTLSFATGSNAFSDAYGVSLPTTSFSGLWVFYQFRWNGVLSRWVIISASR